VGFGVMGGINLSEINASGNESLNVAFTDKTEPVGGAFLDFDVADSLSIRLEGLLSTKGSRFELGSIDRRIRLRYVEVPVMLRYAAPAGRPVQLHLAAGPYAAYLIGATSEGDGEPRLDRDEAFETLDVGWVIGLGIGLGRASVDLRYSGGVTDIAAQPDLGGMVPSSAGGRVKYRNRGFTLVGAYEF
jgi:hypothetical protein